MYTHNRSAYSHFSHATPHWMLTRCCGRPLAASISPRHTSYGRSAIHPPTYLHSRACGQVRSHIRLPFERQDHHADRTSIVFLRYSFHLSQCAILLRLTLGIQSTRQASYQGRRKCSTRDPNHHRLRTTFPFLISAVRRCSWSLSAMIESLAGRAARLFRLPSALTQRYSQLR